MVWFSSTEIRPTFRQPKAATARSSLPSALKSAACTSATRGNPGRLAFLKVPLAASAAVPVGPVGHNARRVLAMLRDPARTALVLVAVPEEMAVVEAVQFHRMAQEEIGLLPSALVLNACHERRFSDEDEAEVLRLTAGGADGEIEPGVPLPAALRAARRQIRRRKLTRFYQARLRRSIDAPLVSLPFLFREELGLEALRELAARLEAA